MAAALDVRRAWIGSSGASSGVDRADDGEVVVRAEIRTRGGQVIDHVQRISPLAGDGVRVERGGHDPCRAHRPRPGRDRPRDVAGLEDATWYGTRAARVLPGPEASGARRPLESTVRPHRAVRPAAGERRPGRRPLARRSRTIRAGACGSTSTSRRQVSATHYRAEDLATATHDVELVARAGDDRPPRCRPSRVWEPRAAGRTRCPATSWVPATYRWSWTFDAVREGVGVADPLRPDRPDLPPPRTSASAT